MAGENERHQQWLESLVARLGAFAGTVHIQRGDDLYLTAAHNIPRHVAAIVARVPHGKGMAGAAQVKKAPVQTCNLQTDGTTDIRPGARAVDAQAAVAIPVLDADGGVRAVVGVAWKQEGAIDPATEETLMTLAAALPQ